MLSRTHGFLLLALFAAPLFAADSTCGDRGGDERKLAYVEERNIERRDAPVLQLLPRCRFRWQGDTGTFKYDQQNDTLQFEHVRLPWGQAAVLHRDTDIVFLDDDTGGGRTALKLRQRRWSTWCSICPLWPVCASEE